MTGECADEHFLYNTWFPPKSNTLAALRTRLIADYPEHIVDTLMGLYYPDGKLPENCRNWNVDAWGRCYADMQVHKIQRGFLHALTSNSAGVDASRLLYRYRIEWRAKCVAPGIPVEWGVTHSSDYPVWFWGNGKGLEEAEKEIIGRAFVGPLCSFVKRAGGNSDGGEFGWGTSGPRTVRTLKGDGRVVICEDEAWEDGVRVWKRLRDADKGKARL